MSGRLLLIEARRTPALWLVPLLVFLCFRTYGDRFTPGTPLWILTSVAIGQAATIIGPPVAGIAAWIAGRERRRGMPELLATTLYSPLARLLTTWLATTGCGLLIYGLFAVGGGIVTARGASWGGPDLWLILVGAAAIMAYCAIGFAIGVALPYRFIAPLVAIGLLVGEWAIGFAIRGHAALAWLQYLSPVAAPDPTVWFGGRPAIAPFLIVIYLGFIGAIWVLLSLRLGHFRVARAWLGLVLAILPAAIGAAQVSVRVPQETTIPGGWYDGMALSPYTPVCRSGPIEVCVHPAYAPWLDELAPELNTLLAPLVGISGMPTRAEQVAPNGQRIGAAPIVPFLLDYRNLYDARQYAVDCAVFGCTAGFWPPPAPPQAGGPDARMAIARWLRLRVGDTPEGPYSRFCAARPGQDTPCLAAERFAALDPATQQVWLEAHFADLRAGRVTLGELP